MRKNLILLVCVGFLFIVSTPLRVYGQDSSVAGSEETMEASVTKIVEEKNILPPGSVNDQRYQKLELLVTHGSLKGKTILIEHGTLPVANLQHYVVGNDVVVTYLKNSDGEDLFFISDYVRRNALFQLFVLFMIVAVVVGKWRGLASLLGMILSFGIIFRFILPLISSGKDPTTVAILGSFFIVPITFYLSHGMNKKTSVAVGGTLVTLLITGVIANYFVDASHLTGFASEEAGFLQSFRPGAINIRGLLLAGIIIGGLGIFDDVTVSQSSIVAELKAAVPESSFRQLFVRGMNVGRDHIASMVNTLVLVYAGAALPLLLLFVGNSRPFLEVINYEFIADEIVRTLVASIGLMLAVPITTFMAALAFQKKRLKS